MRLIYFILDHIMRGSILCLLLITGIAATKQYGDNSFPKRWETNVLRKEGLPDYSEKYHAIDTVWADYRQNKRAFPTYLFRAAWTKLIATTYGFRFVQLPNGQTWKLFVKIGTEQDALADFKSPRPKNVEQHDGDIGGRLTGQVEGKYVVLREISADIPVPVLQLGNKNARQISYVETPQQAQAYLQNVQKSLDEIYRLR